MSTKAEQETTLVWDQETREVTAWTAYPPDRARWERLGLEVVPYGGGWRTKFPAAWVHIRPPRKLNLTPEQLEQRRESIRKARSLRASVK